MYLFSDNYFKLCTIGIFPIEYYNKYIKQFSDKDEDKLIFVSNIVNNDLIKKKLEKIKNLIFITKVEYLDFFYNNIIPLINKKFVLLTHFGGLQAGKHNKILNHPLLLKWYGPNMSIINNKVTALPLGLEGIFWGRVNTELIEKYKTNEKNNLLYLNFSLNTHPNRKNIMKLLLNKGFKKNETEHWSKFIESLSHYKFCISPRGSGIDCHRTWECLYLGVIPIVEKNTEIEVFNDLPILFVENYDIISEEYLEKKYKEINIKNFNLEKKYKEINIKNFNLEKITLEYWENNINRSF